ncbi:MAG: hypothetical protein ACREMW_15430, partial [Gemmatimonadales bacterium]
AKVSGALDLIEKYDPRRLARMRRDLRGFALIGGGGEFYHHGINAYVMDLASMRARSIPDLAATMVHEATHARLMRAGIKPKKSNQERIERICTEAEASFALSYLTVWSWLNVRGPSCLRLGGVSRPCETGGSNS